MKTQSERLNKNKRIRIAKQVSSVRMAGQIYRFPTVLERRALPNSVAQQTASYVRSICFLSTGGRHVYTTRVYILANNSLMHARI